MIFLVFANKKSGIGEPRGFGYTLLTCIWVHSTLSDIGYTLLAITPSKSE